jgi:hypothetical protein
MIKGADPIVCSYLQSDDLNDHRLFLFLKVFFGYLPCRIEV